MMESKLEKKVKELKEKGKDIGQLKIENYDRMIEINKIQASASQLQQEINNAAAEIDQLERKDAENVDRS